MNNSPNTSSATPPLRVSIQGLGHIPSIKNSMYAIVDKEKRGWKKRCVQSFVSRLLSALPTNESEIPTPLSVQSLIASLPPDDNWKNIREIHIQCVKVNPGEEGAEINIERLASEQPSTATRRE